jgi:YcaO-like protein with predicted kinase domain
LKDRCLEAETWQRRVERDVLVATPIVTQSGHVRHMEATYRWVLPKLRRVPITRVYDATPLDQLGVPVWAAVTPLAADLTVHAGKGLSAEASRPSAIMEGFERVCGEAVASGRPIRASYEDLLRIDGGPRPLDPESFDLPFETIYHPGKPISWIVGYDLIQRRAVLVAYDLVISPAVEGVCRGVETNGLASGNTYLEAIVHALYELIERDSAAQEEFRSLFSEPADPHAAPITIVDPETLPDQPRGIAEQVLERGMRLCLQKLHNTANVPVYGAVLIDTMFPGNESYPMTFGGYGCDLDPTRAVLRAITEAVQSHTVVAVSARDTFEGTRPLPDRATRLRRNLQVLHATNFVEFDADSLAVSDDLLANLNTLLGRVSAAGFEHCVVVDLARDDIEVPVARVLVPGLAGPYGFSSRRPNVRLLLNLI